MPFPQRNKGSTTLVKTQGDRDSPKGRTLYCNARSSMQREKRSVSREDRDMKVRVLQVDRCKPIEGADALEDAILH